MSLFVQLCVHVKSYKFSCRVSKLDEFAVDDGQVLVVEQTCNNRKTYLAAINMPLSLLGTGYLTHVNHISNLQFYN